MKVLLTFLTGVINKGDSRTVRAKINISVSFICKAGTILVNFIIVPITLGYLGKIEYGIWLTISSIISWFSFFDVGLGNGLRNKLAEALAKGEKEVAKVYISTSYIIIILISSVMFSLFYLLSIKVSWSSILNTNHIENHELFNIVIVVFFMFCVGFVLKLLSSILQAMQKYALNDIMGLIAQILGLVAIILIINFAKPSLLLICVVFSAKSIVVTLIASLLLFGTTIKEYRPRWKYVDFANIGPLVNIGWGFFVNQILYLVVTQTQIFLVVHYFGPEKATIYNIGYKLLSVFTMMYIMVLRPLLSAFTEAYTKGDFEWMEITIKKLNRAWLFFTLLTLIVISAHKTIIRLWVGGEIVVPVGFIILLGVSEIFGIWASTYTLILNGLGKIKIQFKILMLNAIFYFPASYILYRYGFGLSSLVIPNLLFNVIRTGTFTTYYKKTIKQSKISYQLNKLVVNV